MSSEIPEEPTYVIIECDSREAARRIRMVVIEAEKSGRIRERNRHHILAPDGRLIAWYQYYTKGRKDYETVHRVISRQWAWVAMCRKLYEDHNRVSVDEDGD